jgi:Transposase DDE domain
LRRVREAHGRGTQGVPKVPFAQFVWALVVHAFSDQGSLGLHLRTMTGVQVTDSAAIQRRAGLRWEWFEALFAQILRPLAQRSVHPESFYHGHRLLALDGSEWSLRNTDAITTTARSRHTNQHSSEAAFYKWGCAVLIEAGTHQPLSAARSLPGLDYAEGELNIARRTLGGIARAEDTLLLADRLYGCGRFIADVRTAVGARCKVLLRVKQSLKAKVIKQLSDGSALVEITVCVAGTNRVECKLVVREIRGWVSNEASPGKRSEVRLWTTLLDAVKYPAAELLALYTQRWEQELFFRELKSHVSREHLLRAGSEEGAAAEFGALIIAAGLLAQQRVGAAQRVGLPVLRISVRKISMAMEHLLPVLAVANELITEEQRAAIIERFMQHAAKEAVIPVRRKRSCQRGVRKPVCSWPRIHSRVYLTGCCLYEVIVV